MAPEGIEVRTRKEFLPQHPYTRTRIEDKQVTTIFDTDT